MIFIDSNIWCYYFNSGAEEHAAVAKALDTLDEEICVNTVVLLETAHYLVKNAGAVRGRRLMEKMLNISMTVFSLDYSALLNSLDSLAEYAHTGVGGRDASIIAAMKCKGIKKLMTHDKAFLKVGGLDIIDPVV